MSSRVLVSYLILLRKFFICTAAIQRCWLFEIISDWVHMGSQYRLSDRNWCSDIQVTKTKLKRLTLVKRKLKLKLKTTKMIAWKLIKLNLKWFTILKWLSFYFIFPSSNDTIIVLHLQFTELCAKWVNSKGTNTDNTEKIKLQLTKLINDSTFEWKSTTAQMARL